MFVWWSVICYLIKPSHQSKCEVSRWHIDMAVRLPSSTAETPLGLKPCPPGHRRSYSPSIQTCTLRSNTCRWKELITFINRLIPYCLQVGIYQWSTLNSKIIVDVETHTGDLTFLEKQSMWRKTSDKFKKHKYNFIKTEWPPSNMTWRVRDFFI